MIPDRLSAIPVKHRDGQGGNREVVISGRLVADRRLYPGCQRYASREGSRFSAIWRGLANFTPTATDNRRCSQTEWQWRPVAVGVLSAVVGGRRRYNWHIRWWVTHLR